MTKFLFRILNSYRVCILCRSIARNFLEGGSKSSKMSATIIGRQGGFWYAERLRRYILDPFQWDLTYSSRGDVLSALSLDWGMGHGQGAMVAARHCRWQYEIFRFS